MHLLGIHGDPVEAERPLRRRGVAAVAGLVPAVPGPAGGVERTVPQRRQRLPVEQRRAGGGADPAPARLRSEQRRAVHDGELQPVEDLVEVGRGRVGQPGGEEVEEIPRAERHGADALRAEQEDGRAAQPVGLQRRRRPGPEDDGVGPEPHLDVAFVAGERQVQRTGHRADPAPGPEAEQVLGDQPVHQRPQDVDLGLAPAVVGPERDVPHRGSHVPILARRARS